MNVWPALDKAARNGLFSSANARRSPIRERHLHAKRFDDSNVVMNPREPVCPESTVH